MKNKTFIRFGNYFSCLFAVPFLGLLSFSFILIGIALPIFVFLYELGFFDPVFEFMGIPYGFHFNIGFWILPSFLNIPASVIIGIAFFFMGKKVYLLLKKYLKYVFDN